MVNEIQPNSPPIQPESQVRDAPSTNWPKILLLILFGLIIIVGSVFIVIQNGKNQITPSWSVSQPTASSTSTIINPIISTVTSITPNITISQSSIPSTTKKTIHLYPAYGADPNTSINQLHVISLLFVPKDINTPIKPEWLTNMEKVNLNIKSFFEKQFSNTIKITYKTVTEPIIGNLNLTEYTPRALALEAKENTKNLVIANSHNVWMIYLVRDPENKKNIIGGNLGGLASLQSATQFEFWLDNDAINSADPYGIKGSLHEFAHALGIPHPWELSSNTAHDQNYGNVPGDLMGYVNSELNIDKLYIRNDVKQEMGL